MKKLVLLMLLTCGLLLAACGDSDNAAAVAQAALPEPASLAPSEPESHIVLPSGEESGFRLPIVSDNLTFTITGVGGLAGPTMWRITPEGILQSKRVMDAEWVMVHENVRSIQAGSAGFFFITEDNTLWLTRRDAAGELSTPELFMANIARVYHGDSRTPNMAISVDGNLYSWSSRTEPRIVGTNAVKLVTQGHNRAYLSNEGGLYYGGANQPALRRDMAHRGRPMIDAQVIVGGNTSTLYFITADYDLWLSPNSSRPVGVDHSARVIASDVTEMLLLDGTLYFIKKDGSLWGHGRNIRGEPGDGTHLLFLEPFWVADNVMAMDGRRFLSTDGTVYRWERDNPAPVATHTNVLAFGRTTDYVYLRDGTVWVHDQNNPDGIIIDNVRPRSAVLFD